MVRGADAADVAMVTFFGGLSAHLLPGLDRNAGRWFGRCGSEGHVAKQADG